MIARVWKGWTKTDDADAYEKLLREVVYPGLQAIKGYLGGYILRHDGQNETEFVAVNFFESLDAVKAFAGPDYDVPVFEPEARRLLSKVEPIARHYEVRKAPQQQPTGQQAADACIELPGLIRSGIRNASSRCK